MLSMAHIIGMVTTILGMTIINLLASRNVKTMSEFILRLKQGIKCY
ncbi:hypothetical protein [Selenihalanaerobacter shriftii]|uniref:Uncharacterized protein n=1 Tax=Selenihalanaerobacter shriftii TaxID=142842 RepID=A0A1T4MPM5_9FIRM|nr:hypothetical protein [Selenihalanaerobacter shriftii]SJZ68811.1 hypothetical protein SAMN02745118_01554 [Selenihalanaerobacter shriftii]